MKKIIPYLIIILALVITFIGGAYSGAIYVQHTMPCCKRNVQVAANAKHGPTFPPNPWCDESGACSCKPSCPPDMSGACTSRCVDALITR